MKTKARESKAHLADLAARGDARAAFDLCLALRPSSITEFVDYVRPSHNITTKGFDALADALHLHRYVQERKS